MISALSQQKNAMCHIYEQYESSYDSVLFVQGMLKVLSEDLASTTHTRRAEINTMTTTPGVQLRKIILSMHDNLAKEVRDKSDVYLQVAHWLQTKTRDLDESIKEAEHCHTNYVQSKNFIQNKTSRIDQQLDRLSKVNQEYQKNAHIQSLAEQFHFQNSSYKDCVHFSNFNITNIKNKLQQYKNEQNELHKFTQTNENKYESQIANTMTKLKKIQEQVTKFDEILTIFGSNSFTKINDVILKLNYKNDTIKQSKHKYYTTSQKDQKYIWTNSNQISSGRNPFIMRQSDEEILIK